MRIVHYGQSQPYHCYGDSTMNADQLSRAADLAASAADLAAHDTAIMADWATSKITVLLPIETVAAYMRANGVTADGTPSTYAAMAKWGKHYARIINYRPAVKTPELALAAGIDAPAYVPPRRQRVRSAVTVDAVNADDATALAAVVDAVSDDGAVYSHADPELVAAVAAGKRAKRRAKRGEFRDAAVTGNPADFARE